jgi:hypothetical protein
MVRAVLCAGLFPSVVQCKARGKRTAFFTKEDGKVEPHPSSVNARVNSFPQPWLVYSEKVKTTGIYVRDSTNLSDYALLMFGGSLTTSKSGQGVEMLDGYLQFQASKKTTQLVQVCSHWSCLSAFVLYLRFVQAEAWKHKFEVKISTPTERWWKVSRLLNNSCVNGWNRNCAGNLISCLITRWGTQSLTFTLKARGLSLRCWSCFTVAIWKMTDTAQLGEVMTATHLEDSVHSDFFHS